MKNSCFYIPFSYFVGTRIADNSKLFSWACIYLLPTFYLFISLNSVVAIPHLIISYLLATIIVYNNYEIGYIQNDCETTKTELNPTMRVERNNLSYYEHHKIKIYSFRILVTLSLLFLLFIFTSDLKSYFSFFIGSMLISVLYLVYNRVRSRLTLLLHFFLVILRYFSPLLLLIHLKHSDIFNIWGILLLFPVLNLFERAGSKRFRFPLFQKITSSSYSLALFRTLYYCCLLILFAIYPPISPLIFVSGYFFVYRLFILLLLTYQRKPLL